MLQNINSSDISLPYGHSSQVLSLEAGRDFLYFALLVMVFLGVNTGQSGQGQAVKNLVTGRSEPGHGGRVGFTLFALTQKCSRCNAGIYQ